MLVFSINLFAKMSTGRAVARLWADDRILVFYVWMFSGDPTRFGECFLLVRAHLCHGLDRAICGYRI